MLASEEQIAEVERYFGVRFPNDYRHFLLTRGAMKKFVTLPKPTWKFIPCRTSSRSTRPASSSSAFQELW